MSQQLTRTDQLKPYLFGVQKQVESLLMDKDKAKRFLAAGLVVAADKALSNCSPDSIAQALVGVAMSDLNIDKNIGHCYLVPYGYGDNAVATLQIGYKGYVQLLFRAGWAVKSVPVYHCDKFSMSFDGWDNKVLFEPSIDERDEGDRDWVYENLRGVYVVARHADTHDEYSTFVSKAIIEKLRLNSPNQTKPPKYPKGDEASRCAQKLPIGIWQDWYVEMSQAKAVKKLAKMLPIGDPRTQIAIAADDRQDIGAAVDYKKTAETGVVIDVEPTYVEPPSESVEPTYVEPPSESVDDIINSTTTVVNTETGEIEQPKPSPIADELAACNTLSDLARFVADLDPAVKAENKGLIQARQAEIKETRMAASNE